MSYQSWCKSGCLSLFRQAAFLRFPVAVQTTQTAPLTSLRGAAFLTGAGFFSTRRKEKLKPSAEAQEWGGRPSRGASKREAKKMLDLATLLCELSGNQLSRVTSALPEELYDAIIIARGIEKRRQGRKRQVNLVARLLREESEEQQARIQSMAGQMDHGRVSAFERNVQTLAANWEAGLLKGDKAVTDEVNSFPPEWQDLQHIRQLVRKVQKEAESASQAPEASTGVDVSEVGVEAFSKESPAKAARSKSSRLLTKQLQELAARYLESTQEPDEPVEGLVA